MKQKCGLRMIRNMLHIFHATSSWMTSLRMLTCAIHILSILSILFARPQLYVPLVLSVFVTGILGDWHAAIGVVRFPLGGSILVLRWLQYSNLCLIRFRSTSTVDDVHLKRTEYILKSTAGALRMLKWCLEFSITHFIFCHLYFVQSDNCIQQNQQGIHSR